VKTLSVSIQKEAISTLRQGGVIIYPTETAYGLGADAKNLHAVEKIFVLKGRATKKTFPLIVADLKMAQQYAEIPTLLLQIAHRYWPGPLTIVAPVKKKTGLAESVIQKDGTVALRVSSCGIARTLSYAIQAPLIATSANYSGDAPSYSVRAVKNSLKRSPLQPEMFLDVGALTKRCPSTIISEKEGKIVLLRRGTISIPKIYVA